MDYETLSAATPYLSSSAIQRRKEKKKQSALLTTIALCVHSLAVGVSMGASLYLSQQSEKAGSSSVGIMIVIALFLHKAPEAAGYGTFIVAMQSTTLTKLAYIAAYSISSPLSAFISCLIFCLQSEATVEDPYKHECLNWWTGVVLLFAVGTLSYITLMHILPEVYFSDEHDHHDDAV